MMPSSKIMSTANGSSVSIERYNAYEREKKRKRVCFVVQFVPFRVLLPSPNLVLVFNFNLQ